MPSLFDELAAGPRPTGGEAIVEAQRYCTDVLERMGFVVTPRPFEYSAFTGKVATPLAGAWLGTSITAAAWAALGGRAGLALGLLVVALVLLALVGRYLATTGVVSLPIVRRRGLNLAARRGNREPTVWLVAHIDSKWQPVPMAVRAAGVVLLAASMIAGIVMSIFQWRTGAGHSLWAPILIAGWIGALPVMLSVVGEKGPGAVDNASGVATVLEAAQLLGAGTNVGVLITDAEELALAGALAWVRARAESRSIALNCDGVDDEGRLTVMFSGRRPDSLVATLHDVAASEQQGLRVMRMIPGVLTDSVAFAGAGWTTATLSRGSLRTLRRVHTMGDNLAAMRGTGIAPTARVLAGAAMQLAR
jgi:hypothetical protein